MTRIALRMVSLLLATCALAACGNNESSSVAAGDTSSPAGAVLASVEMMQNNDVAGLLQSSLPPAQFQQLKAEWGKVDDEPISDEDRAKFAKMMQDLTGADAEQALFAKLQPFLAQYDSKYKAQIPMYVGMGQTMAATAINQSKDLNASQKQQAMDAMAALAGWVSSTDWSDESKAKQAIAVVTDTARQLDIDTLDQARSLTFEQSMPKLSTAMAGTKEVLAVYGFDIDKMLDSVTAETVSETGDQAKVHYTYTLLGHPISGELQLVKRDGRWFNKEAVEGFEKAMAEAASSAAAPAAEVAR